MSKSTSIGIVCLSLLAAPMTARGAGFRIAEQGAAATGMVGAFTAKADDASAIFYNPAGLARLRGLQVYVGGTLVIGQPSINGTSAVPLSDTVKGETQAVGLPTLYLSYGLGRDFAVGIGAFTHYGLSVEWPSTWPGRFVSRYASLQSVTINPAIAWRPVRWMSIGGGIDLTPASVELQQQLNLVNAEAGLRFRGNAFGVGGNVGVLFEGAILQHRTRPLFSAGVTYRSSFDLDFDDGGLTFARVPLEFSGRFRDQRASATLPIPDVVQTGIGLRPIDRLFVQAQLDWVRWKRFQTLELRVRDDPSLNQAIPENWGDGYTLRVGAELELSRVRARLGFGYDWTPVPKETLSPTIPDSNRYLVSGGVSVDLPARFVLDLSVMGVIFNSRRSALPQFAVSYSNYGVLTALAISYRAKPAWPAASSR